MNRIRQLAPSFALLFGLLGAAAVVVVWCTSSRLSQVNENIFTRVDKSLAAARDRVLGAQKRVQESKITAEDIGESIKNLTRKESSERLASRLELERRIEQLTASLRQVDLWLELSSASVQGGQQAFEIASSLGAHVDTSMLEPLLERLDALQRQLKQSTETIDTIRERLSKIGEGKISDERINQVTQLVLRIVATLSQMDSRLGEFADRLVDTQAGGERLKSKTRIYIITALIGATLIIVWMAAGQISLCRNGLRNLSQRRPAAEQ